MNGTPERSKDDYAWVGIFSMLISAYIMADFFYWLYQRIGHN